MYVVCVQVHVKADRVDDFTRAILDNAAGTRKEPGNVRFDVLQAIDDAARFVLYEAYRTPEDFQKHQQTPHYLEWKETVKDWMAEPRTAVKCRPLFPPDAGW